MIDLHTHSTASDGTLSPTELVKLAAETGLKAIALTDHDTLGGVAEAVAAGKEYGVEVIPGCELSLESPAGVGWMHMVALFLPPEPEELQKAFDWVIEGRKTRNHEIVEKLRQQGINITYEAVAARAGGTIGRPHFAQELLALRVVSSVDEAFKVWLGDNGRAYIPKRKLQPKQALDILNNIGATSILAHPFALGLDMPKTEKLVSDLMDMGLERHGGILLRAQRIHDQGLQGNDRTPRAARQRRLGLPRLGQAENISGQRQGQPARSLRTARKDEGRPQIKRIAGLAPHKDRNDKSPEGKFLEGFFYFNRY